MLPSLRSITALGITAAAGAMFFLGAAAPAAAQEVPPAAPEAEQQAQGSGGGLLDPVLGQSSLVNVFIGNYQVQN